MISKNHIQPLAPRGQRQTERPFLLALTIAIILSSVSCGGDEPSNLGRCEAGLTAQVERWRSLVEKHFKYQHVTWALNIMTCESRGDPKAYNASSGASGLFQHLKKYWPSRATSAGFPGASAFDPEPNIAAAAWLLYTSGGGPQHWSCQYSPFENFSYTPQFYKDGVPVGPPPPPPPPCGTLPAAGGTIDEMGSCFELHGPSTYWRSVTNGGLGGHLYWTNATKQSAPSNWARWSINVSAAGKYEVFYYAIPTYAVFAQTRYVLHHGAQDTTLLVDQGRGGAGWRSLGVFAFNAGTGQHLSVYDNTPQTVAGDQHIIADAIKLVAVTTPPPPPPPQSDSSVTPPQADSGVAPPPQADSGVAPPRTNDAGVPEEDTESSDTTLPPDPGTDPNEGLPPGPTPPAATPPGADDWQLDGGCALASSRPGPSSAISFGLLLLLGLLAARRSQRP